MGFFDSINTALKPVSNFVNENKGLIDTATGLGSLYMSYKGMQDMQDSYDEQNKLLRQQMEYNKALSDRNIAKENMAQDAFTSGFNQAFADPNKKKKSLGDYAGMTNFSV